jgi:hypothetical protein
MGMDIGFRNHGLEVKTLTKACLVHDKVWVIGVYNPYC